MRYDRYRGEGFMLGLIAVVFVCTVIGFAIGFPGRFQNDARSVQLLENQGFTDIEQTKREVYVVSLQGCGNEDTVLFTFNATNPAGREVTVQTCQGWPFKGATIRE